MARTFYKSVKNSIKYWWVPMLIGFIFIGSGIYSFLSPITAYEALAIVFSISFLFSGISEMSFAISNKDEMDNWGWTFAFGLLTALMGLLLIFNPVLSLEVLAFYIGFLVLFRGISGVSYAFELKNYGSKDWGTVLLFSIFAIIFAFILLSMPELAGLTAVVWVGVSMIIIGIVAIFFALQLKKIKSFHHKIPDELRERYERIRKEIEEFNHRN